MSSRSNFRSNFKHPKANCVRKAVHYVLNGPNLSPEKLNEWKLYFSDEECFNEPNTQDKVQAFEGFVSRNGQLFPASAILENRFFHVDVKVLQCDATFQSEWGCFNEDLTKNAEHTLSCLSYGMRRVVSRSVTVEQTEDVPVIRARVVNYEPVMQLKELKVNCYGKLVSFRGTVIRVGGVRLSCRWMAFECKACRSVQVVRQPDGKFLKPTHCEGGKSCRSLAMVPLLSSPHTRTAGTQLVKLQESVGDGDNKGAKAKGGEDGGRVPRTVECELSDDLVDACVPGDHVTVTAIIKVRDAGTSTNHQQGAASTFLLYADVVSVCNDKVTLGAGVLGTLSTQDCYLVQNIHAEPQLFRLLVNSLCPTIYGHEVVKAGLVLALFGGTSGGSNSETRSDSHVLLVGDPGLGKSQMLQACATVAPRGVFVCGNASTGAGLTATVCGGGLEAGALVLADRGVCCVDELDKMSGQHGALLETMEQQTVSVAKAGCVCTLGARTSVLAAANPAAGHYRKSRTVAENLRLGSALLSRFDLVFVLMDRPDERSDTLLSEHVLALHARGLPGMSNLCSSASMGTSTVGKSTAAAAPSAPLAQRLKLADQQDVDLIPQQMFRKYVGYARTYVHPLVSTEAADILRTFYVQLRRRHRAMEGGTPVTTRQLESLVRLTQARAKLELREVATAQDALDVVEIMQHSLIDTFSDDHGCLDFDRSQNGSGVSSRAKVKRVMALLQRTAELQSSPLFSVAKLKETFHAAGCADRFYDLLNSLNVEGYLLKKGPSSYQLMTLDN